MEDQFVETEQLTPAIEKIQFLLTNEAVVLGLQPGKRLFQILRVDNPHTQPLLFAVEDTDHQSIQSMSMEEANRLGQPYAPEAFEEFFWAGRKEPTFFFELYKWENDIQTRWQRVLDMLNMDKQALSSMFNRPTDGHDLTDAELGQLFLRYMGV